MIKKIRNWFSLEIDKTTSEHNKMETTYEKYEAGKAEISDSWERKYFSIIGEQKAILEANNQFEMHSLDFEIWLNERLEDLREDLSKGLKNKGFKGGSLIYK